MSTLEPDNFLGREIAGYQIEEIIGRGGMGVVYRAEHIRLGRKVALKVVAPQIAREEKFRERFLRESRTAGTLDHPNVVPMYDAGEADGVLYIAMRFVDGVDLASLIEREGPLEPARAARIVAQVASALDAAHEAGLVHRDVKPSNVLLPARGAGRGEHAYLGDFGLTKRVLSESGVTGSSAFLGTIAYVAPEQIEGRQVDARADQYSLACLTYETLTGHRPFDRDTDIATLYAHIRDPFPGVGEAVDQAVAPALDAVLARAGAKAPADRYPSCGDMAEDLLRVTNTGVPGSGPLPVVAPAGGRRPSRRRLALGAVAAVAVLGLVAGAVYILGRGPAGPLVAGNGLVLIDATTNGASAVATFTEAPTAIAAEATGAWITHFDAGMVSHVDADGYAVSEVEVGTGPQAIVAAVVEEVSYVWVANTTIETMTQITVEDPPRVRSIQLQFRPGAMAFGEGFLWVIEPQADAIREIEIPPRVGEGVIEVGADPVSIASGAGALWTANRLDQSLSRVTIGLTAADPPIDLNFTPGALALDEETDALWIVDATADSLVRYNVRSRDEVARIPLTGQPVAVAVGAGSAWVVDADGVVSRIDPATNTVSATIMIGGAPHGIAVFGDQVWVAVAES